MTMLAWQRGRRAFTVAAILMVLVATAHTLGFLAPVVDRSEVGVREVMAGFRAPLGLGMSPSYLDIFYALAFTMSVTIGALGAFNLLLAGSREATPALLRRVTWLNLGWVAAYLAVNWRYHVPPPLVSAVIVELVLLAALVLWYRGARTA
jgi:hypothetical protein